MTTTPDGTYRTAPSGLFTLFEPVVAANPPAGSDGWPVATVSEACRLTLLPAVPAPAHRADIVALSRQLAEKLAKVPADQRAELLAGLNAEITRAVAAAG
jgi:hypothetical protein